MSSEGFVTWVTRPLSFGPHVCSVEIVRIICLPGLRWPRGSSAAAFNAAWGTCVAVRLFDGGDFRRTRRTSSERPAGCIPSYSFSFAAYHLWRVGLGPTHHGLD